MLAVKHTNAFKKDYKLILRRGYSKQDFIDILKMLMSKKKLPDKAKAHKLAGEYVGFWECHIQPDWLLIYDYQDCDTLVLRRTGSHADLFK